MSLSPHYIELYLKTKIHALGVLNLYTRPDGVTCHRAYRLKDKYISDVFKKARTLLLLNHSNSIDLVLPLDYFVIYKQWPNDINRTATFCKYGAITNYPDSAQEAIAGAILEVASRVKYPISNKQITLTISSY